MREMVTDPTIEKKKEVKELIESIQNMPNSDDVNMIRQLAVYLQRLLRVRIITPPVSEIMIMLQKKQPRLYHATRFALNDKSHLQLLFEIRGNEELAEKRLHDFLLRL